MTTADKLVRLGALRPELRPQIRKRLAMEFDTPAALEKYLKEHPKADAHNHTVKEQEGGEKKPAEGSASGKVHPLVGKLDKHTQGIVGKMPTKWHDKDTGYDLPAVKAAAKELTKLPIKTVHKILTDLETQMLALGRQYRDESQGDGESTETKDAHAQVTHAWRAAKLAEQDMRDAKEKRDENPSGGGYMPRAELKKRRKVPREIRKDLERWEGSGHRDPIHKVLEQMREDGGYVRHEVLDKALAHLDELAKHPAHAGDEEAIKKFRKELAAETGRLASTMQSTASRVASRYLEAYPSFAMPRPSYLPPEVRGTEPNVPNEGTDLAIWSWDDPRPRAIAFQGKADKPLWNYNFQNDAMRQRTIAETIRSRKDTLKRKQEVADERKNTMHGLTVGAILTASWGYDQTQIDWFQVIATNGKQVTIREIQGKVVRTDSVGNEYVVAMPDHFLQGEAPLKKIPSGSVEKRNVSIKLTSYKWLSLWDGKPKYQTGPYNGH